MSRAAAIRLVKSLSKSEKRQFKLSAKRQSGNKDYLDLFDIVDRSSFPKEESIVEQFSKSHPYTSIDNTAAYLVKILTDNLIQSRVKEDNLFQLLHGLLRVNILYERNLPKEGFKELKRLQQIAADSKEQLIQFMLYRYELNYYAGNNFPDVSENHLVEKQMKARDTLKDIRNLHEHYALYELLKYRLTHSGRSLSEEDKKQLNDLLLSEMSIVNARVKSSLESKKLHLLFQSYFFTDIGDYRSALKTFYELNRLFEKNIHILKHPPLDYFSALDGILDSLRTMTRFGEMEFYIDKLEQLDEPRYPEYFRFIIRKTVIIYKLAAYTGTEKFKEAVRYIERLDPDLLRDYSMVDEEKQNELLFSIALAWFRIRNFKKAKKYINQIVLIGKTSHQFMIYKASRLLNILIHYEEKDLEYLDYEIRSYKRTLKGNDRLLQTEKLVFKVIRINPDFNRSHKNQILWKSVAPLLQAVEKDKYETQLLKYFDFTAWVRNKFNA